MMLVLCKDMRPRLLALKGSQGHKASAEMGNRPVVDCSGKYHIAIMAIPFSRFTTSRALLAYY